MMGNSMERGGPPGMMNPRMNPPRGPGMGPMSPGGYGPAMRGPPPQGPGESSSPFESPTCTISHTNFSHSRQACLREWE